MSTAEHSGPSKLEVIAAAMDERGILRTKEIVSLGISREYVRKLASRGVIERVQHGIYQLPHANISVAHSIAVTGKRSPDGVICLLSALRLHGVTTQSPFEVWIAVEKGARGPKMTDLSIRIIRLSGVSFSMGIETREIEGVKVRVYSLAKTIADCFKFRNKIGLDVALEALRECIRGKLTSVDDIWKYAKICRVSNVIRPYLEAIQ
jgi:predicted transcriptional regulator of viral defense system